VPEPSPSHDHERRLTRQLGPVALLMIGAGQSCGPQRTLSRWRHGFESRWGCHKKDLVIGPGKAPRACLVVWRATTRATGSWHGVPCFGDGERSTAPSGRWQIRVDIGRDPLTGIRRWATKTIEASGKRSAQRDENAWEVELRDLVLYAELAARGGVCTHRPCPPGPCRAWPSVSPQEVQAADLFPQGRMRHLDTV
jgi:hypothetical protein